MEAQEYNMAYINMLLDRFWVLIKKYKVTKDKKTKEEIEQIRKELWEHGHKCGPKGFVRYLQELEEIYLKSIGGKNEGK